MYPAYMWTDSYPNHINPIPNSMHYSPKNDDPRAKEITSHMNMDPKTLNSPYQPWPYGGNYCYPMPPEYHGCCNHSYFGGSPYSFRPPYPHYPPPPPPQFYPHGFYPPFPGTYPAYSVPPPHYSNDQARYDYEKGNHTPHHCCGCKHQNEKQEKPKLEQKANDSLVPIMWVPPGYMNTESKKMDKDKDSHDDSVSLKQIEPINRDGNDKIALNQHTEDGSRFPFPIFCFPSKNNEVGNEIKEAESEVNSNHGVQKVIPVIQLGTDDEKKCQNGVETKAKSPKDSPKKSSKLQLGPDDEKKCQNGVETKAKSPKDSPKKSSKLPPVCLRIDPMPKKKSSRSPSPPGYKERSNGSPVNTLESSQQQTELSEGLKKNNIETIKVINDDKKVEKDSFETEKKNKNNIETIEVINDNKKVEKDGFETEKNEKEKKNMSEHEAASIIQSVYRGFEVRKSQPLMKLRQINEVRKQTLELRNRIQDLESSSNIRIDGKQKLIFGETMMSLLLKLDTIQGLHPTVRDLRKSVAKELVGLQEKLDSLTLVKSETLSEETTIQEKPDQVQAQAQAQLDGNVKLVESGLGLCENHQVEAAEACNTNVEPQLEFHSENTGELDHNQLQVSVESARPDDDVIQEKLSQSLVLESGLHENHEVKSTESMHETHDINPRQLVEPSTKEFNDNQIQMSVETEQPTSEFGDEDARCSDLEPQVESKSQQSSEELSESQFEVSETGQQLVEQENPQFESNGENVESSCEHPEVETKESRDDGNLQTLDNKKGKQDAVNVIQEESVMSTEETPKADEIEGSKEVLMVDVEGFPQSELHNDGGAEGRYIDLEPQVESKSQLEMSNTKQIFEQEKLDQVQAQFETNVESVKSCEHTEVKESQDDEVKGIQEEFIVSTEEAPNADEVESSTEASMVDVGGSLPVLPTESRHVSSDGDGNKLMEENEKLRVAMEELMKSGNEQLGVIKELTTRVKDLEKKLSKKNNKKKMKVSKCRSRGRVVEDELRSYVV